MPMDDDDFSETTSEGVDEIDGDGGAAAAAALGFDTSAPEFYDPEADEKDSKWAAKLRKQRHSDAILSCPCCFTTVCLDCQEHATLENQYRAMFVMNCKVDTGQVVRPAPNSPSEGRRGRSKGKENTREENAREVSDGDIEQYNPVQCALCSTELGLREVGTTGVYHFFHVIASNS